MSTVNATTRTYHFLDGGGELGEMTRNYDWAASPVGPVELWPQSLKTLVGTILHSGFPMFLWWGEEMVQFYNDAYRPSLGETGKHPKALGQFGKECWPEIWEIIYPLIHQVQTTGKSFFLEDQLVPIFRNGMIEDVYWTFSYTPVIKEDNTIGGVLVICHETTKKVVAFNELKSAQRRLSQSELNLKNIILQAPVAMAILKGPKHVVEIANDRMFALWGKSREETLDQPIFDLLVDARDEGFEEILDRVYRTGETHRAYGASVTLPRDASKEVVYVHFVYEAFHEADGSIGGVMVVAVDVTSEMIARKRLEASENRIRSLVESAPFPIGVYEGAEMRIVMVNQAIIDAWGKGADLIGKTYFEVLPELEGQAIYPQLSKVLKTGEPFHARNQRVDLVVDGKLKSFYFNYDFTPLFDGDGKVYGVLNTAADVTDLNVAKNKVEQSERNFRNMVKQAPVAMCIMMGPDHVVEVANDLILQLWGKSEESVINKPMFEAVPEARNQGLEQLLDRVYATGSPHVASEHPVDLKRNGVAETVYQNFVYEPYRDASGVILGVLAITVDVTPQVLARLKIEEIVKERTESLRRTNAELSQFAYIASHDLQEPARKISTFVELLGKTLGEKIEPRAKTYIDKIEKSSERMLRLIRDVLTISQLSKTDQEFRPVNLTKTVEEIRTDYELLIEEKACRIVVDPLPVIMAIPVQMSQLFANLFSNALKFSDPARKLTVEIRHSVVGGDEAKKYPVRNASAYSKIDFKDNGIGFSQENASQIFNIFQRLHGKQAYEGTGIGLAMCKKIVENHGGYIFATSEPSVGTTFTVILPNSFPGTNGGSTNK